MPKGPILMREAFFYYMRGTGSGSRSDPEHGANLRQYDFNVVTTSLGTMVEPAQICIDYASLIQEDAVDQGINAIRFTDDGNFPNDFGSGGYQLPVDFNK